MSLLTPIQKVIDVVFPGENWFLYWKTSSSLWKSKIEEFSNGNKIIVPINWSFHVDVNGNYDFGTKLPETDLKKLVDIIHECNKTPIFFLPLSPAPFLTNGGIPHFLAANIAKDESGMAISVIDSDGGLNKVFSFYDPKVFGAYNSFISNLGSYIKSAGIGSDIWAVEFGHLNNLGFNSFFRDYSSIYDKSFMRFLQVKKEEMIEQSGEFSIGSDVHEAGLRKEFNETIKSLYLNSASEFLDGNFEGTLKVALLGSSPDDFICRLTSQDKIADYMNMICKSMNLDITPSSVLLPEKIKSGVMSKLLKELVTDSFLNAKLSNSFLDERDNGTYYPLSFFEVFENSVDEKGSWEQLKLWDFLDSKFKWCFKSYTSAFSWKEEDFSHEKVYFIQGKDLDEKSFLKVLKLFMNGGNIVLNTFEMSDAFLKRTNAFFLENDLEVEEVNFLGKIQYAELGEGKLLLFNSNNLEEQPDEKRAAFWERVVSIFEVIHLDFNGSEDVNYFWRTRPSSHTELKFEQVRRLTFYNASSYKKRIKIPIVKNFALLKIIDEHNVNVKSHSSIIDLEMLPNGALSLDFGIYL